MANTGITWGAWNVVDAAIALTQGGTVTDVSDAITVTTKAACKISIDVDYSNHAKATDGLHVYILADIDGTDYEAVADLPFGFEMPFLQNGTRRRSFAIDVTGLNKFKIALVWGNTTGSAVATVATAYMVGDVPLAS